MRSTRGIYVHGVPLEYMGRERWVHKVHEPDYDIPDMVKQIVWETKTQKRDIIMPITGVRTGDGKSATAHALREKIAKAMGIPPDPDLDYTVFHDWSQFADCYSTPHPGVWKIWILDEGFHGFLSLERTREQTAQIRAFGSGRFLQNICLIPAPYLRYLVKIVRNLMSPWWVLMTGRDEKGVHLRIRKKCYFNPDDDEHSHWDCMNHLGFPAEMEEQWFEGYDEKKFLSWNDFLEKIRAKKRSKKLTRRELMMDSDRQCYDLYSKLGNYSEVGRRLGVPLTTVFNRVERIRKIMSGKT